MGQLRLKKFVSTIKLPKGALGFTHLGIHRILSSKYMAYAISLVGILAYGIQSLRDIIIQTSFIDEGGYLYLGSLYARGILTPYQDFGARSIYAPLSLLIPGYTQVWFGPGLLTGRLLSFFLGLLMLVGLWLVAHRVSGKWGAALAVCAIALTPAQIMVYSAAISEVLVSCMLVWMLFFILGEKQSITKIVIGSMISGLIVMTRQNMLPLVPMVVGYIFWQNGKKIGFLSLVVALLPIIILHALYWPNILVLWTRWLPSSLTPFLDGFRPIGESSWAGNNTPIATRLIAFFQAILFNYIPVLGVIVGTILWPKRHEWKNQSDRRLSIFLATLFWVLLGVHAYVTILDNSNNPCTFCLTPYLSFFSVTGILLVCSTFSIWRKKVSKLTQVLCTIFVLIVGGGLGFARFEQFGAWLLTIRLPAIQRGWKPQLWFPGFSMAEFLGNKYNIDFWSGRIYVSIFTGVMIGLLLILLTRIIHRRMERIGFQRYSFSYLLLVFGLFSGIIISPLARGDYREESICPVNIPEYHQQIGAALSTIIPPGSQVSWEVSNVVPLLYAPGITIYPAQVYIWSSYREASDSRELLRMGFWNDKIRAQWIMDSDFLVFQPYPTASYVSPLLEIDLSQYIEYQLPALNPCNPDSYILVYERKK